MERGLVRGQVTDAEIQGFLYLVPFDGHNHEKRIKSGAHPSHEPGGGFTLVP